MFYFFAIDGLAAFVIRRLPEASVTGASAVRERQKNKQ